MSHTEYNDPKLLRVSGSTESEERGVTLDELIQNVKEEEARDITTRASDITTTGEDASTETKRGETTLCITAQSYVRMTSSLSAIRLI
jgi:hypothetical protein